MQQRRVPEESSPAQVDLEASSIAVAKFEFPFQVVLLEVPFEIGLEGLDFPFHFVLLDLSFRLI